MSENSIQVAEPPPVCWSRCLYLEWHGNGGHFLVEVADAQIWLVEGQGDEGMMNPLLVELKPPFDPDDPPEPGQVEGGLEGTAIRADGEHKMPATKYTFGLEEEDVAAGLEQAKEKH